MRLGICAIFKNEAEFLVEWISYHHMIGVDRFFLYDHGSTDGSADVINASPFRDIVVVKPWIPRPGQLQAYSDFFVEHAEALDWVAVIDVDEFIVTGADIMLKQMLQSRDKYAAVLLNWLVFGPSGHVGRPSGLVTQNYTKRLPAGWEVNKHVKSIVQVSRYRGISANPHVFLLDGKTCNAAGEEIPNIAIQEAENHSICVLHHYYTKSEQDWMTKLQRGKADTEDLPELQYKTEVFYHVRDNADVSDRSLRPLLPRLEAIMRFCKD